MIRLALASAAGLALVAAALLALAACLAESEARAADDEADDLVALGAPNPISPIRRK